MGPRQRAYEAQRVNVRRTVRAVDGALRGAVVLLACVGAVLLACGGCSGVVDKQAAAEFRAALGSATITVFPVYVRDGEQSRYDQGAARQIGEYLRDAKLAEVTFCDAEVPIKSQWGMNQARMFRDSVRDFAAHLKEHPIETQYALLSEYLLGGGGKVMGVHVYLLRADGTCAHGALLNSHHGIFRTVNPQTADDCTRIVLDTLRAELEQQEVP